MAKYESLMKTVTGRDANDLDMEEWRIALWRQSDRLALDRTDVAGVQRKRPAPPAVTNSTVYSRELGHPSGTGRPTHARGEYLGSSSSCDEDGVTMKVKRSSSVGTGRSKWVKRKEYEPWNPTDSNTK